MLDSKLLADLLRFWPIIAGGAAAFIFVVKLLLKVQSTIGDIHETAKLTRAHIDSHMERDEVFMKHVSTTLEDVKEQVSLLREHSHEIEVRLSLVEQVSHYHENDKIIRTTSHN